MAFWDDDFDFGDVDYGDDFSYRENYDADFWNPEEFQLQPWQQSAEPNYNLNWQPPAPGPVPFAPPQQDYLPLSRYDDGTAPDPRAYAGPVEERNPVTGTISRIASRAGNWIADNPKDALGMATGVGLGAAGLFMKEGKVGKPDMGPLNAARAALEAQASKTSRINDPLYEESVGAMRGEIAKGGGQYDPRLVAQRAQLRAEMENKYGRPGGLGLKSDQAMRDFQEFDRQTTSLLEDDATRRSQMRMSNYQIGANTGNPEQTTGIFSRLAQSGLQGAALEQQGASTNAQLQENRRNSMLTAGGNIFGRSITTNPFQDGDYDPKTGKKKTAMFGSTT